MRPSHGGDAALGSVCGAGSGLMGYRARRGHGCNVRGKSLASKALSTFLSSLPVPCVQPGCLVQHFLLC